MEVGLGTNLTLNINISSFLKITFLSDFFKLLNTYIIILQSNYFVSLTWKTLFKYAKYIYDKICKINIEVMVIHKKHSLIELKKKNSYEVSLRVTTLNLKNSAATTRAHVEVSWTLRAQNGNNIT
jgi:UDP-N-acetylglucosamine:LPS N-acetylglucosamine transferase